MALKTKSLNRLFMKLLKVKLMDGNIKPKPEVSTYVAAISGGEDQELLYTLLAANVNILRRQAPYAYLIASQHYIEDWRTDSNDYARKFLCFKDDYYEGMEKKQLHCGVWLAYPHLGFNTTTVVVSILDGDVLPAIDHLFSQEFSLLCLPQKISLDELDQIVCAAESAKACFVTLLSEGGCLVTIVDHYAFEVQTLDESYSDYFL